ncbi:RHS repeat-associated core domain-containing protein, partial [Pantoea sp. B65]|uniref:RHS repeat-associated core domain-containing protein n=1 Tax=Pantoea sp. B65 TaxID=2813359 RepID=UPI0039B51137
FAAYTRSYLYDRGGNLTRIRHSAPASGNNYTTDITVSTRSNRALISNLTAEPAQVEAFFTAGGQQTRLQPGQSLNWTARGELLQVTPVVRDGQPADHESYRYNSDSQRIIKTSVQKTGNSTQTRRALWLPRIELRSRYSGESLSEALQVISVGEAGRAQVRVLHWLTGKPDGISNNQLRYSYDNLVHSSELELDADGNIISQEEYYPYGGTAVWNVRSQPEADYKTIRYAGKERDASGLYYYGYRYYQPWAGRWLSADPAGTVDGLNLFAMVRNNPLTYRDDGGKTTISENFNARKGDLVYGLDEPRYDYIVSLETRQFKPLDSRENAVAINFYHSEISRKIFAANTAVIPEKFIKKLKKSLDKYGKYEKYEKYVKKLTVPADIKDLVRETKWQYPLWESFFALGDMPEYKKFNISAIYQEVQQFYGKSRFHKWRVITSPIDIEPLLLWKRGSKLGIALAANDAGNKIHFVLDSLNIEAVVKKKGDFGESFTASELRYAYRNREKLAGKIHFYQNNIEVAAPWITDPALWASYLPRRRQ